MNSLEDWWTAEMFNLDTLQWVHLVTLSSPLAHMLVSSFTLTEKREVTETACGEYSHLIHCCHNVSRLDFRQKEELWKNSSYLTAFEIIVSRTCLLYLSNVSSHSVCWREGRGEKTTNKNRSKVKQDMYSQICKKVLLWWAFSSLLKDDRWSLPTLRGGMAAVVPISTEVRVLLYRARHRRRRISSSNRSNRAVYFYCWARLSFLRFREQFGLTERGVGRRFVLVSAQTASTAAASWGSLCSAASQLAGAAEERER